LRLRLIYLGHSLQSYLKVFYGKFMGNNAMCSSTKMN
ncbi:MAG: hypothetical protein ACI9HJ_001990, partial [Ulvibacter sp.]